MPAAVVLDEDVTVDGFSLRTLAVMLETVGSIDGLPARRGENSASAYVRGRRWVEKVPEQRGFTLVLTTNDVDPDTGVQPVGEQARRAQVNANNQRLLALFGVYHRPLTMVRQLRLPSGMATRTGYVEASAGFGVEYPDGRRWMGKVSVDLTLHEGVWWGEQVVTNYVGGSGTHTITNPGTAPATDLLVELQGPLTNPSLVNTTYDPDVRMELGIVLATDQTLTIDTGEFTASLYDPDDGTTNVIGAVTQSGARHWLQLAPGPNQVVLASDAGEGNVDVTFTAPYW